MKKPRSAHGVRRRLVLSGVALIGLTLAAFGLATRYAVERVLVASTIDALHNQVDNWDPFRKRDPRNRPPDAPPGPPRREIRQRRLRFPIAPGPPRPFHPPRIVAVDSPDGSDRRLEPWSEAGVANARRNGEDLRHGTIDNVPCLILSRAVRLPDGRNAVIQAAGALDHVDSAIVGLGSALLILFPVAIGAAAWLGNSLTRRVLKPVDRLVRAAANLDVTRPDARLPDQGDDEFGRLGAVLNDQIERMRDAYERQRRFAADASHELRTPLAVIKSSAQITREHLPLMSPEDIRDALGSIEYGADRAHRLVQDLLILARGERGLLSPRTETIDIRNLFDECLREVEATAPSPHAKVQVDVSPEHPTVESDPAMLGRIVANVLQNALRHTPPSGWVRLNSRVREDGGTVLEVCDNGPGMSAETLEQIGRPFQRPDAARNREDGGAGLGIALCRTFALALGAQFELNSEPGAGTTATISLRAAPRETNA